MIYCIWYPPGGFGHFINGIMNLYGREFIRPKRKLKFSTNGNSHHLDLVAPTYCHDQDNYSFNFSPDYNYSVLIDNGIHNESPRFTKFFPDAKIIKICYNDHTWPIIAHTMIVKGMNDHLSNVLSADLTNWSSIDNWSQREKYFLFLRDHKFRQAWRPDKIATTLNIDDLLNYNSMYNSLTNIGIVLEDFYNIWEQWYNANALYINPVLKAADMIQGRWHNLTTLWDQAVFYYMIWLEYSIEVPHNTFSNFFQDQTEYTNWIREHNKQ